MKILSLKRNYTLVITSFSLVIILLFTTCDKEPIKHYYDIKGRGYVFDIMNNIPFAGAKITVQSFVEGENSILSNVNLSEIETYTTDLNGYYEISFMKKYGNLKISRYYIQIHFNIMGKEGFEVLDVTAKDVDNAETNILFDPILIPQ